MYRNITRTFTFLALLFSVLFISPSISSVNAGTWTINLVPSCPSPGDVPLNSVYPMYAFWPPTGSSALNWSYGAYTKSTSAITIANTNGGTSGYVALRMADGTAVPGLSSVPASTYIEPTWSGFVPVTKMFRFAATSLPNGTYTFNYQMPAGTCGSPSYTVGVSAPVAVYKSGQEIYVTWNFTTQNQPTDITQPYSTTISIQRGNAFLAAKTTLGTVSVYPYGSSAAKYTIPYTLGPASDYYVSLYGTGQLLRSGITSSSTISAVSPNAFTIAIPPPSNFKGVCTGTVGTFTWTPPAGITNYYWRLTDLTSGAYVGNEELGIANVTGSSFTYNFMVPGHNYRAWIHSKIPTAAAPNWSDAVYSEFNCPAPSPTPTPTRTPTPTPSNTPTPSYTPSPSPTPQGYCTSSANCSGGKICVNNGCQVPSPTPTPTTVPSLTPSLTPTITPTSTPIATPTPNCSLRNHGDADCSCVIDSADYTIWRKEFLNEIPQERADFSRKAECKNTDGSSNFVCTFDLEIWRDGMTKGLTCANSAPTAGPTGTPIPASTVMPTQTPVPVAPTVVVQPTATPTPRPPTATPPALPPLVDNNYLGVRTKFVADESALNPVVLSNLNVSNVTIVSSTQVVWPNGCKGCGGNVCTQATVGGYEVVVSGASTTAGKCIFKAYHFTPNATTMCEAVNGRVIANCGTNPFPPASSTTQ